MRIVMIGTGYVGLVSGACFADFGHHVTCVDKDKAKIDALLEGRIPIFEPGLDDLVASNVANGRLDFSLNIADVVPQADAVFIAVGTPSRRGDGHGDRASDYHWRSSPGPGSVWPLRHFRPAPIARGTQSALSETSGDS